MPASVEIVMLRIYDKPKTLNNHGSHDTQFHKKMSTSKTLRGNFSQGGILMFSPLYTLLIVTFMSTMIHYVSIVKTRHSMTVLDAQDKSCISNSSNPACFFVLLCIRQLIPTR